MLLPKQVVQVEKIFQWAVTTWTISRGSFYVNIRVKLARYVCNSESKWKILDEVENTICTCIKAYFRPETSTWKVLASNITFYPSLNKYADMVQDIVQYRLLCSTLPDRFQVYDLYEKRKASPEQKKTDKEI